jgi:hypothetical protein
MGHHSIQVTVDIYGHLVPEGNREAVDKLDEVSSPNAVSIGPDGPTVSLAQAVGQAEHEKAPENSEAFA